MVDVVVIEVMYLDCFSRIDNKVVGVGLLEDGRVFLEILGFWDILVVFVCEFGSGKCNWLGKIFLLETFWVFVWKVRSWCIFGVCGILLLSILEFFKEVVVVLLFCRSFCFRREGLVEVEFDKRFNFWL